MDKVDTFLKQRPSPPEAANLAARIIYETAHMPQKKPFWNMTFFKVLFAPIPMTALASFLVLGLVMFNVFHTTEMQMSPFEELSYVYEMELTARLYEELE